MEELASLVKYDPEGGTLQWNGHPTQPHLNGRPVGISRGRIKFKGRFVSLGRLIYFIMEGKPCVMAYVLFKDGNFRNIRYSNLIPSNRSISPARAKIVDDRNSKAYTKTATHMRSPLAAEVLMTQAVENIIDAMACMDGVWEDTVLECNHILKQVLENANNR